MIRQNSAPLSFTTLPAAAGAVTPPGGSGGSGEGTSEGTTSGPSGCGTSNQPAVATVWATYTVSEGFEGQIQATNTLDPEDTGVFFEWKVTDGHGRMTTADLQDRLTSTVRFTAPQAPITIDLELFVKDALSCGTRYPIELVVVRNVTGDAPLDVFLGIPDLSEDTILDVQIPGGFWISGTVGTPVAAQTADFNLSSVGLAYAVSPAGERYWGGLFDGSQPNQYRIAVPAGSYQTVLCFNGSADGTFLQIGWKSGDFLEVSADVSRNATLKIGTIYEVSGVVTGLDAIPDPHPGSPHPVSLFFFSGEQGPGSEGGTLHIVGTGLVSPTGTFSVHLLEGVYQVQAVIFRDESTDFAQFTFLNLGLLNVTGPTIGVQIPLPPLVTVGGKVEKDIKSSGIAGELDPFTITAHGLPFPDTFPWFQERCLLPHDYSDDEVFHQVFSETYDHLLLQSEIPYNISAGFLDDETGGFLNVPWENVHSFSIESEEPAAANFTLDVEVPEDLPEAYELTGKVTGPDFEPFQGALVLVGTINLHNHINVQFGHSDETDENGRYSMMLRAGRNYAVGGDSPESCNHPGIGGGSGGRYPTSAPLTLPIIPSAVGPGWPDRRSSNDHLRCWLDLNHCPLSEGYSIASRLKRSLSSSVTRKRIRADCPACASLSASVEDNTGTSCSALSLTRWLSRPDSMAAEMTRWTSPTLNPALRTALRSRAGSRTKVSSGTTSHCPLAKSTFALATPSRRRKVFSTSKAQSAQVMPRTCTVITSMLPAQMDEPATNRQMRKMVACFKLIGSSSLFLSVDQPGPNLKVPPLGQLAPS